VIDLKLVREDADAVRGSQRSRGEDPALVDALLEADTARRAAISAADSLRAEQKTASRKVGSADPEQRPALLERAKQLAAEVKDAETRQAESEASFSAAHAAISNVIIDGVPAGGADDYAVLDVIGEPRAIPDPRDHLELGEALGLIDMERGAKVSGSRFYFLTGRGALLQLGLLQLAVRLATDNGFTLMIPTGSRTMTSIWSAPPRFRSPAITPARFSTCPPVRCVTPGGRPASVGRPAAMAGIPAGSSGCTSSTRSRVSSTAGPVMPNPNTSGCWGGSDRCWS